MKKRFDIAIILKAAAVISVVFMLGGCGVSGQPSSASIDPDTKQQISEQQMEETHRTCWQSSIVGTIYKTTGKLTMSMYSTLSRGAMALMMVAFAVWLAFQILKHVSSFTEESPAELWTEVCKKFFICFVCGLLATSTEGVLFVLNSIIFPLYNAFLELGSVMISQSSAGMSDSWKIPFMNEIPLTKSVCQAPTLTKATLEGFPDGPREMMECLTCSVGERLNFGIFLGWKTISMPGVTAFVCGFLLVSIFFIVKLSFAFYIVDAIFRFAMVTMMLPLLIMSFAFKATSKCAKSGFFAILNSGAFMMMIATVMIMVFSAIQRILIENQVLFEDESSFGDISAPMMLLLLTGFLTLGALNVAKSICDKLVTPSGGGATNVSRQFASFLAWGIRKTAVGAGMAMLDNSAVARNAKGKFDGAMSKLNKLAGRK